MPNPIRRGSKFQVGEDLLGAVPSWSSAGPSWRMEPLVVLCRLHGRTSLKRMDSGCSGIQESETGER
jgi:hypothetical protein